MFSLLLSALTGLLFGVVPALQASRPGLVRALKDDAIAVGPSRSFTVKKALVVGEVAISFLLLMAAGLFIRSLRTVQTIDPGFAVEELVSAPLNVNLLRYTKAQGREFYTRVVERIERLPGVRSASVARVAVLTGAAGSRRSPWRAGPTPAPATRAREAAWTRSRTVDEGQRRRSWILPDAGDPAADRPRLQSARHRASPLVAIVSESMAKQFFPGEDPIGRRFTPGAARTSSAWIEIVGVARDSKYSSLSEEASPVVYFPLSQQHETGVTLYVRATGSPAQLVSQLRREIQTIEPNLPVPGVQTLAETIGTSLYAPRMGAILLTVFGALALLLAALGVYSVLAFSIARRTREIGIRVALGADRSRVLTLILREGMTLVAVGLAIGLAAAFFASGPIARFLFDVSPRDATAFTVVPCILAAVALLACYLQPAGRCASIRWWRCAIPSLIRGASPLGLPDTRPRSPLRRLARSRGSLATSLRTTALDSGSFHISF